MRENDRNEAELDNVEIEAEFDEMSVVELEERLELAAGRCVCRNA